MIICDVCKKNEVQENGQKCEACARLKITELAEDREGLSGAYLPPDLYQKYMQLLQKADSGDRKAQGLLGKMLSAVKTSFLDDKGKTIVNPVPDKVFVGDSTLSRVEREIKRQANILAQKEEMETEESLNNWDIDDIRSDEFEQSVYQIVSNIEPMADEVLEPVEPSSAGEGGVNENPPAADDGGTAPSEPIGDEGL